MNKETVIQIGKIHHSFQRKTPLLLNQGKPIGLDKYTPVNQFIEKIITPDFLEQISKGNITLAAIKPQTQNSRLQQDNDID